MNNFAEKQKVNVTLQKLFLVFNVLLWQKMVIKVFKIAHRSPKGSKGALIVQYSKENVYLIDFISIMAYFAIGDHLQHTKVTKSYKLTDYSPFLLFTD